MFSKKETAKILAVMLLSVFMFSLIAGVIVSGQLITDSDTGVTSVKEDIEATADTIGSKLRESLISLFTLDKIDDLETRNAVSKFLLTILLILLIYAFGDVIPFVGDKIWIRWGIAVVVSVLAFIFVKDVSVITRSLYEPLGIALVSIIPLIVLISFTVKLRDSDPRMAFIVNKVVIVLFALVMVYNAIAGMVQGQKLAWIYFIGAVVAIIWMLVEREVWKKLFVNRVQGFIDVGFELNQGQKLAKVIVLREQADELEKLGDKDNAKRLRIAATNLQNSIGK